MSSHRASAQEVVQRPTLRGHKHAQTLCLVGHCTYVRAASFRKRGLHDFLAHSALCVELRRGRIRVEFGVQMLSNLGQLRSASAVFGTRSTDFGAHLLSSISASRGPNSAKFGASSTDSGPSSTNVAPGFALNSPNLNRMDQADSEAIVCRVGFRLACGAKPRCVKYTLPFVGLRPADRGK